MRGREVKHGSKVLGLSVWKAGLPLVEMEKTVEETVWEVEAIMGTQLWTHQAWDACWNTVSNQICEPGNHGRVQLCVWELLTYIWHLKPWEWMRLLVNMVRMSEITYKWVWVGKKKTRENEPSQRLNQMHSVVRMWGSEEDSAKGMGQEQSGKNPGRRDTLEATWTKSFKKIHRRNKYQRIFTRAGSLDCLNLIHVNQHLGLCQWS